MYRPHGGASRLTWRLLHDLIAGLPGESLTKTAMRDALTDEELAELAAQPRDGHGPWSRTDLRIASLEDAVRENTWWMLRFHLARDAPLPPPEPVHRPGIARKRHGPSDADRAYLAHLRANRGALPDGMKFIAAS